MRQISTHYASTVGELQGVLQQLPPELPLLLDLSGSVKVVHCDGTQPPGFDDGPQYVELFGVEAIRRGMF